MKVWAAKAARKLTDDPHAKQMAAERPREFVAWLVAAKNANIYRVSQKDGKIIVYSNDRKLHKNKAVDEFLAKNGVNADTIVTFISDPMNPRSDYETSYGEFSSPTDSGFGKIDKVESPLDEPDWGDVGSVERRDLPRKISRSGDDEGDDYGQGPARLVRPKNREQVAALRRRFWSGQTAPEDADEIVDILLNPPK